MVEEEEKINKGICPVCDSKLVYQEGCMGCKNCGWTACTVA